MFLFLWKKVSLKENNSTVVGMNWPIGAPNVPNMASGVYLIY